MKRLTPASVTWATLLVVGLLVTAHYAKMLVADAPRPRSIEYESVPTFLCAMEPGTEVTAAHLKTTHVRADLLDADSVLNERSLIGRVVKERIVPGTPIRSGQLYAPGERPPLAIASGMRGVSVSLPDSLPPGLRDGQFVDVYLTPRSADGGPRGGITVTLFRGVRVVAVMRGGGSRDSLASVTLELSPGQANVLILAREKGQIALSLNPEGKGTGGIAAGDGDHVTLDEILGSSAGIRKTPAKPVEPPARAIATFTSESYKGSARTTLRFPVGARAAGSAAHPVDAN